MSGDCAHGSSRPQLLLQRLVEVECRIPYNAGNMLADIRKSGTITEEIYGPSGTQVVAFVPPSLRNKLQAAGYMRKAVVSGASEEENSDVQRLT